MKKENFERVIELLNKSEIDIDFRYNLEGEDFETTDDIRDILEDAGAFDEEIIHYSVAMEFLTANDNSLRNSLQIAQDMGYKPEDLSSEILASLLASEINRELWGDISGKLDDLLKEIIEEEANEEEEEA